MVFQFIFDTKGHWGECIEKMIKRGETGTLRREYGNIFRKMDKVATVRRAWGADEALGLLAENPKPHAIYIMDAKIMKLKDKTLTRRVVEYTKAGGTVVLGMAFSASARPRAFRAWMMVHWHLIWQMARRRHSTSVLNLAASGRPGGRHWSAALPGLYDVEGPYLTDIRPKHCWYICTSAPLHLHSEHTDSESESTDSESEDMDSESEDTNSKSESTDDKSESTDKKSEDTDDKSESTDEESEDMDEELEESEDSEGSEDSEDSEDYEDIDVNSMHPSDIATPAAFTRVGEGYLGYTSDTHQMAETDEVVLAMMGLKSL